MDTKRIEAAVREILFAIGEDPDREGLAETPRRVAGMCGELFAGLRKDPRVHAAGVFRDGHKGPVMVKDIPFASLCEHHLLPFFGAAHVAYLPKEGRIIGLGKIAEIVDDVSKRPQIQERITATVADVLWDILEPQGVLVVLEAEHLCMSIRGVKKPGARTVTSAARGVFDCEGRIRDEVMAYLGKSFMME